MSASTILLVDDDEVLSQVLQRVLSQQGYNVLKAGNVAQARDLARQHHPDLGLFDLFLPDGDGVELAAQLDQEGLHMPLLLLTAYPLSLRERPEAAKRFARILTKPVNLQELREAVEATLADPAAAAAAPRPVAPPAPTGAPPPLASAAPAQPTPETAAPAYKRSRSGVLVGVVLGVVAAACLLLGVVYHKELVEWLPLSGARAGEQQSGPSPVLAVDGNPNALQLTEQVADQLKLNTADVKPAEAQRPLELPGSLGLDTDHLVRVRSLFFGKVVEIGSTVDRGKDGATSQVRPLRFGDEVEEGQLLAVVWSKDLGEKKSELIDALSQLKLDEQYLKKLEELDKRGGTPEFSLLQARRNVEQDRIAVRRAEATLRSWNMEKVIKDLYREADRISESLTRRDLENDPNWARVELTAPFAGILVEKNTAKGDVIDPTVVLFQIADVKRLTVWANVREEDLPRLTERKLPIPWTVRLTNNPEAKPLPGEAVTVTGVDPTQHTALVMGYVANPGNRLRTAQFATATIEFPPPPDTVQIPASALLEDGTDSVVFVQPDPDRRVYVLKRVKVFKHHETVALISNDLTAEEVKRGLEKLNVGERVVTQNVQGMKAALEELRAKEKPAK